MDSWKPAEERRRLAGAGVGFCHHCRKQQQANVDGRRVMTAFVWLLQMHIPNPVRRHATSAFEPHSRTPEKAIDDTVLSQYFTTRLIHNHHLKLDVEDYKSTQLIIAYLPSCLKVP